MQSPLKSKLYQHRLVLTCAILGFVITFLTLNNNYVQYTPLPEKVGICDNNRRCDTFSVKQSFRLKQTNVDIAATTSLNREGHLLFHYDPAFLTWTMLILLLMTLCAGSFPVFINYLAEIKKNYAISNRKFISTVLFGLLIVAAMLVVPIPLKGYYNPKMIIAETGILLTNPAIIQYLIFGTIFLVLPVILTMFMIGTAANIPPDKFATENEMKVYVEKFSDLNGILITALQVLAVVVVLTGFCSSALRQSVKSVFEVTGFDIFPKEMSYAYGLFYALFLALFYIPVYYTIQKNSKQLKSLLFQDAASMDEKTLGVRDKLGQRLEIKASALETLKMALTILSPLLASFIPEQLQVFK